MLAVVLPVVALPVGILLLAVGHPEALRGQVPAVRAVLELAAVAPGVVAAEDAILELLTGVAVGAKVVAAVVLAVAVLANQPLPTLPIFQRPSLCLSPSSFPLLFP